MREIVLDTETTGLDPAEGHRIVEIGAIELFNLIPTGAVFHRYLNPEREVSEEARAVHGLSAEKLRNAPRFADVAEEFLAFIGDAPLVIHNAEFDLRFLNSELARLGLAPLRQERVVDTMVLARRRFPGAPISLDALCSRLGIDRSARTFHGALLDSQLLAEVYLELCGGRQRDLALDVSRETLALRKPTDPHPPQRPRVRTLPSRLSAEEKAAHAAFVAAMGQAALWCKRGVFIRNEETSADGADDLR